MRKHTKHIRGAEVRYVKVPIRYMAVSQVLAGHMLELENIRSRQRDEFDELVDAAYLRLRLGLGKGFPLEELTEQRAKAKHTQKEIFAE